MRLDEPIRAGRCPPRDTQPLLQTRTRETTGLFVHGGDDLAGWVGPGRRWGDCRRIDAFSGDLPAQGRISHSRGSKRTNSIAKRIEHGESLWVPGSV